MEVDVKKINMRYITLTFKDDYEEGISELTIFSNIFRKLMEETRKININKIFDKEEVAFIREIGGCLTIESPKPVGIQEIPIRELAKHKSDEEEE